LAELIDYAGFFPPAGLTVGQSAANYAADQAGDMAWMLGRLVLPTTQLATLGASLPTTQTGLVRISAVVPPVGTDAADFRGGLAAIADFNRRFSGRAVVDALECKVDDLSQWDVARAASAALPLKRFWELALDDSLEPLLAALAAANRQDRLPRLVGNSSDDWVPAHAAKIRTGGVTPSAIPAVARVARFIAACAGAAVAFKATAGLHHPLPAEYPLTYAADAPCGRMHGFLNVFLAATAVWRGSTGDSAALVSEILSVADAAEFQVLPAGIRWREQLWTVADLLATRREFALSFGSCSFSEPVADLRGIGWLLGNVESDLS
jgi:hypothetical protein